MYELEYVIYLAFHRGKIVITVVIDNLKSSCHVTVKTTLNEKLTPLRISVREKG